MVEELTLHDVVAAAGLLCWVCPECFSQHSKHSEMNLFIESLSHSFPPTVRFHLFIKPLQAQLFLALSLIHWSKSCWDSNAPPPFTDLRTTPSTHGWSVPLCKHEPVVGFQEIHLNRSSQRGLTFCLGLVKNFYTFGVHILCSMLFLSLEEICASIAVSMETANLWNTTCPVSTWKSVFLNTEC